ncbi:hypothetical protein RND81_06G052500 [Saponaria officinalis]|uniref:Auxin response factor n=1 Tax=Saponaria officinalis TaxID=3572 RepID=A0AAW1K4B4_SAPOF
MHLISTEEREDMTAAEHGDGVCGGETIWKACAGSLVQIPAANTTAYYFPEGHVEQSPASIPATSLSTQVASNPSIPCRVLHALLLADKETDQVFAKFKLQPILESSSSSSSSNFAPEHSRTIIEVKEGDGVVSFAKVLTQSDANNGGGFSVPRFCADTVFPPLNYDGDTPGQDLVVKDIHGRTFDFHHVYRGTPRRHLLTTGWGKFVNIKKLVSGDTVVFSRNKLTHELFVGIRRVVKQSTPVNEVVYSCWGPPQGYIMNNSSAAKKKVAAEKVVEAVEKAAHGVAFEVEYYPRPGLPEFVVAKERVDRALGVYWTEGTRVKMSTETQDSSRVQSFQGTVVSAKVAESGAFQGSAWRMLEVKWDEHEILKNMNKVSPWQVEYISPTPSIHTTFPPTKRIKYSTNSGLYGGKHEVPSPLIGFSSMMGHLNPSFLNQNPFSAGMQGARHNQLLLPNIANIHIDDTRQIHPEHHDNTVSQRAEGVPIDLNVVKTQSTTTPSPDSRNSVHLCCPTGTKKSGATSFQLFGKTIHMEQPLNSADDINCTEYDDGGAKGAEETTDHTCADPSKNLHDKPSDPCQRPPVAE